MEELRRQAGWAKTFGLPLELISADEAKEMFPLMSTEGVLGGAWLPTDGYLDPSQLTFALADGARRGRLRRLPEHARDRDRGRRRARAGGRDREGPDRGRGRGQRRRHVRGRDRPDGRRAHPGDPDVATSTWSPSPSASAPRTRVCRPCATPTCSIYFREDGGGLVMGGYERDSEPAFLPDGRRRPRRRSRHDFNGRLLEDDWDRFEEIIENSKRRVPAMDEITDHPADQRARGVHPRQRVLPRRDRGRRALRRRRVLRARAGRRRRDRQGDGRVDRRGRAVARPLDMDVRRFGSQYRSPAYTHARIRETYETYYDIRYPNHEREAGRPLRVSPANAWHARARRRLRREVGLGAGQLVRVERRRPATSRCARAAGRASTGRRRSAPSTSPPARRSAIFDESSFAKMEIAGPGRGRAARAPLRQPGRPRGRQDHLHADAQPPRRDRVRLHRRPARRRSASRSSPGPRSATTTASGSAAPPRPTAASRSATSPRAWSCFGIWGPKAREILAPLTPAGPRNEAFPYMSVREITVGNVPVRALRVTYVGELGWELYCPTEYGLGLWRALWEAGEPHGMVAGGYRAIDSMRLEKGYRVWGADITPDETPYEGGVGFCVKLDKEGGLHRPRGAGRGQGGRAADEASAPRSCSRTRARSRSATSRCASAARSRAASRPAATATRSSARSPTPTCRPSTQRPGPRSRSRSSASGSPARSPRSRCSTRRASGSGLAGLGTAAARRGCARCPRCARAPAARPGRRRPRAAASTSRVLGFEWVSTRSGWAISAISSLI